MAQEEEEAGGEPGVHDGVGSGGVDDVRRDRGSLWVVSIVTAGYLFGNLEWVQTHMSTIIWAMIVLPGLLALFGAWRAKRGKGGVPAEDADRASADA